MKVLIKIGTAVLVNEGGEIDKIVLLNIIGQVKKLKDRVYDIAIITSGAVASCPIKSYSRSVRASIGQPILMAEYKKIFDIFGMNMGQFLYVNQDLMDKERARYTKSTLLEALRMGVVPIINANDTVFGNELEADEKYADNDILTKDVALMIGADKVLYLIDQDGLIDYKKKRVIRKIKIGFHDRVKKLVKVINNTEVSNSVMGTGGMASKFSQAIELAVSGVEVGLIPGKQENAIIDYVNGKKVGTMFERGRK